MFGIDDAIMGPVLGAGISGFLAQAGQEDTNSANRAMSQAQMDFQERMSNTAYQRAVKDMSAAGLNPMLAYQQGPASSPGGASAVMQNAKGAGVSAANQAYQTGVQMENVKAQTEKVHADEAVSRTQAALNAAMLPKVVADTEVSTQSAAHLLQQIETLRAGLPLISEQINQAAAAAYAARGQGEFTRALTGKVPHEIRNIQADTRLKGADTALKGAQRDLTSFDLRRGQEMLPYASQLLRSQANLVTTQLPRAGNEADAQSSWWMRHVSPYLPDFLKGTSSASQAAGLFK